MTVFDELIAPVMPIIQQIEHDRPKHQNDELTWSAFTQILMYFFTKDLLSGNELIVSLQSADPHLGLPKTSRRALSEGFWRFSPKRLQNVSQCILQPTHIQKSLRHHLLVQHMRLMAVFFPLIQSIYWPKTHDAIANVKLHLKFSDDPCRSTSHLAIARLFARLNDALTRFWKISKHWPHTLADCLSRPFTSEIVHWLNKYAIVIKIGAV
jgi:hypothetical protein